MLPVKYERYFPPSEQRKLSLLIYMLGVERAAIIARRYGIK